MRIVVLSILSLAISACGPPPQPSASSDAAFPPVLYVENRGGPTLVVQIGGATIATVACNAGATITPNQAGVPSLPWDLKVIRRRDAAILVDSHLTGLPRWLVQIGDGPGAAGLATVAVAGPPGPTCPPGE